jgi:hypothetical protein
MFRILQRTLGFVAGAVFLAGFMSIPGHAKALPDPADVALPDERHVLKDLGSFLLLPHASPEQGLGILDPILAKLGSPTQLRGLTQYFRVHYLNGLGRDREAKEAAEEAIRLLPGYGAPLIVASSLYTYDDRASRAADLLMRAIAVDPESALEYRAFELSSLLRRLGDQNEGERYGRLADALVSLGWNNGDAAMRSRLARMAIDVRLHKGDTNGARALVTKILAPPDAYDMLTQKRFEPIWADVEKWSGEKLANLWPPYLEDMRWRWKQNSDIDLGYAYAAALRDAGHDAAIIAELMPLVRGKLDRFKDYRLVWAIPFLADALARQGRWDDVDRLFAHAQTVWPLGSDANALNLAANRARLLIARGDMELGLPAMDAAIADAARHGGEVNSGALRAMHHYRACALFQLGRDDEALGSRLIVIGDRSETTGIANMHICRGDLPAARAVLLDSAARGEAKALVAFLQPSDRRTMQSEYQRLLRERREQLRADPALLAAIREHGRILPYAISDGAPPAAE